MNEAEAIAIMRESVDGRESPVGAGDDAALLSTLLPGHRRVLSTDALVEGTHFIRAHPPRWLGWKLLAVNLSDVAAMGATPEAFVISAALPPNVPEPWWRALSAGLGDYAERTKVALVGGDIVLSPGPLMFSIAAWGILAGDVSLTRHGGRPGDQVMVAGQIGVSAVGLKAWLSMPHGEDWPTVATPEGLGSALEAHLKPDPPLDAGRLALVHGATAGLDLSDGLATDLPRLAEASGVALSVDLDALPRDPVSSKLSPESRALGGEDYGLAVLVPGKEVRVFSELGFQHIGEAREGSGVEFHCSGRPLELDGPRFAHF